MHETFQLIANIVTSLGMILSIIYSARTVRAARIETELNAFSSLSHRYNEIIEELIASNKFQTKEWSELGQTRFKIYALFDILSVVYATRRYQTEIGKTFWQYWERRISFMVSKPAVQTAWEHHRKDQHKLYTNEFINFLNSKFEESARS